MIGNQKVMWHNIEMLIHQIRLYNQKPYLKQLNNNLVLQPVSDIYEILHFYVVEFPS